MSLTWAQAEPWFKENLKWMRDDVQRSFDGHLNVTTLLQVCSYTDALARLKAGTAVEVPSDGRHVFTEFMKLYFKRFNECSNDLGNFWICSNRKTLTVREVDAHEAFYVLWRHGVVHEYLPKARSPVTRTSDHGDQPYLVLQPNRHGPIKNGHHTKRLHVHLDYLVTDFIAAVKEFEQNVFASGVRAPLRTNCMKRFRFMVR